MNYYYYYNRFTAPWTLFGTTWVRWYQKGKTNLDLLEQEIVSMVQYEIWELSIQYGSSVLMHYSVQLCLLDC